MNIKLVRNSEAIDVLNIYKSCVCQHKNIGFNQWDETYPNTETISNDIENNWLFGAYILDRLVAVISITEDEPKEYLQLNWANTKRSNFIIHRLCVHEDYSRRGIARGLMEFAEKHAKDNNKLAIRLDTYSLNKGALNFYKKLGYSQVGFVKFPKKTESNYTCFEKVL